MIDYIAAGIGILIGGALLLMCAALCVSIPPVLVQTIRVALRREGLPVSYNLRSIARRKLTTAATLVVLALVVFALTVVLMLASGVEHTLESTGDPRNVKVLKDNALSEWTSSLTEEQLRYIAVAPGVAADDTGQPLVSGELVVLVWAGRGGATDANDGANLTVRGVRPVAFDVHEMKNFEGRRFATGTRELIIGKALVGRFDGAQIGGTMAFADHTWTVVGVADHGGNAHDSELWGDIEVMSAAFKRTLSTATARLTTPSAFDGFVASLAASTRYSELTPKREADYWRALSENYVGFVTLVGSIVGVIFSFGAVLGALNTMYAQVAARTRELGTLRAIGFKPRAILTSIVLESVLLSLAAGVVGVLAAAFFGNTEFTLTTVQTLSEITYGFHLTPGLALTCVGFAALMGYAGGLLPALRAARIPIVSAVRAD